jgi:hypothetical protein
LPKKQTKSSGSHQSSIQYALAKKEKFRKTQTRKRREGVQENRKPVALFCFLSPSTTVKTIKIMSLNPVFVVGQRKRRKETSSLAGVWLSCAGASRKKECPSLGRLFDGASLLAMTFPLAGWMGFRKKEEGQEKKKRDGRKRKPPNRKKKSKNPIELRLEGMLVDRAETSRQKKQTPTFRVSPHGRAIFTQQNLYPFFPHSKLPSFINQIVH